MSVTCQPVYVATMAGPDITATRMLMTPPSPCVAGTCSFNVTVTWINQGGTSGNFTPTVNIDGTPFQIASDTLTPGESKDYIIPVTMATKGTYNICPSPN